jgi:septum formation protein
MSAADTSGKAGLSVPLPAGNDPEAPEIVLASASPRRAALMREAGYRFRVWATHADESVAPGTPPALAAVDLAARKAMAVPEPRSWILAADTVIDLDGEIVGKPRDREDARRILASLSGREHWVCTGVALRARGEMHTGLAQTKVTFRALPPRQIEDYVATGEPMDKAGAYAIQGGAKAFVARLDGAMDNVVGLPMDVVRRLLVEAGFFREG